MSSRRVRGMASRPTAAPILDGIVSNHGFNRLTSWKAVWISIVLGHLGVARVACWRPRSPRSPGSHREGPEYPPYRDKGNR